jgi:tRNA (uracil-5-)-methyltransferase TRM9
MSPMMDEHTQQRLRDLNRQLYDTFAGAFSDSRAASEPGFDRIVAQMTSGDRVLDLGCGQARLARLLPPGCSYVGVDFSLEMVREARRALVDAKTRDLRFVTADLVSDPWEEEVGEAFDWVVLRAVLHHIPGHAVRRDVLMRAAQLLAPGGRLVVANWQFLQVERLRKRLLPWSTLDLTDEEVEPGDYLLDWQRQGHGLRYVHLVDEAEMRSLARDVGLEIASLFRADGHTDDLTLYAVLVRETAGVP